MKNFKSTAILFFPSLFFACQPSSVSNPKPAISISKQEVKIGEPVYASSTGQKQPTVSQLSSPAQAPISSPPLISAETISRLTIATM